jgi:hypothetical protein
LFAFREITFFVCGGNGLPGYAGIESRVKDVSGEQYRGQV